MSVSAFKVWGWRLAFFLSAPLVIISIVVRRRMDESPVFQQMRARKAEAKSIMMESFGNKRNVSHMLIALFGCVVGQAVVWYASQFYSLYFMQQTYMVGTNYVLTNCIMIVALLCATPFFVIIGSLSDRIGRKKLMMTGNLLAALLYYPIYVAMHEAWHSNANEVSRAVMLTLLVWLQVMFVPLVYAPVASFLVEFFPTQVRYTTLSVVYHLGNGECGGWLPTIALAIVTLAKERNPTNSQNIYMGLLYPIGAALLTFIVGSIFMPSDTHMKVLLELEPSNTSKGASIDKDHVDQAASHDEESPGEQEPLAPVAVTMIQ